MLAVAMRYAIFSVGRPFALVVLAIAMHGICFDFLLAAGFMYPTGPEPAAQRRRLLAC